ncbi:MAG: MCE family protein [Burkholderiales bacterium]|nr:MCE family protein [Burkholderiales bacterium]
MDENPIAADAPVPVPAPPPPPLPSVRIEPRSPWAGWLIWLVPVIAVVVGLWLGAKAWFDRGPVITISFLGAEGLEAGKTKVRYKDVDIGTVTAIRLTPDHARVEVRAELKKFAGIDTMLVADSRFWIVRPQVSVSGVSGLGTLLSGPYIGLDIGRSRVEQRRFVGLEVPPIVTAGVAGRRFKLKASTMGSVSIGSPLYYRRVPVGQVVAADLDADGAAVTFTVFVNAPYDRFVSQRSRFWHASGVDVSIGVDGVHLRTQSLASIVGGGIAFQDTTVGGRPGETEAGADTVFTLYPDRTLALKQPDLEGHDYLALFASSVRGLQVGAPVEFRGLSIGEVTAIDIESRPDAANPEPRIAVRIRVYPGRLPTLPSTRRTQPLSDRETLDLMTAKGFRAQLRNGNLLTGQLYVALDYFPRAAAARVDWRRDPPLFPTVPGSLDSFQDALADITDKIAKLPLDQVAQDVHGTLAAAQAALTHTDALVLQMGGELTPEARATLVDARRTLAGLNRTLDSVDHLVQPGAPLPAQAGATLTEVSQAAQALRTLADYLERHPESLLRGKPEDRR